jgi:GNAT superfamily N-acetyltransferase
MLPAHRLRHDAAMDVVIRDATQADLPAIVALYADDELGSARDAVSDPLAEGYGRAFAAMDADPRQRLIVAEVDRTVIATLQLIFLVGLTHGGAERAHIAAVRVASPLRGKGIGSDLMQWVIEQARRRGCSAVELMSNARRTDAQRFYARLGFAPTHVGMKLRLDI